MDNICAWQLGPVVPEVYYDFCSYGGRPICACYLDTSIDECDKNILDNIIEHYIDIPASTLVNKSHTPGGAWDLVYKDGYGNRDIIPFSLIKEKECWG